MSKTKHVGQICVPCQQGNIFYIGNPSGQSIPKIRGFVGDKSTPNIPQNEVEKLINNLPGTQQKVHLTINGKTYPLIDSPASLLPCTMPEDLQIRFGIAEPPPPAPPAPVIEPSAARMAATPIDLSQIAGSDGGDPGEVLILDMGMTSPDGQGEKHIDELSDATILAFVKSNATLLNVIGPVGIDFATQMSAAENRAFLKEAGMETARFFKNANGTQMVAFTGNNRARNFLTSTKYGLKGLTKKNVSLLNIGMRGIAENAAEGAKAIGSKVGVISILFVTTVDVAAYYAEPANEREFSDLLVDIGFDLGELALGMVAGVVAAGAVIAAIGAAPVVVVVGIGLIMSLAVGYGISKADGYLDLRDGLKEALRNADSPFYVPF